MPNRPSIEIVADTSPLVAFSSINQLEILRRLFARIAIPQAVADEIGMQGSEWHEAAQLQSVIREGGWMVIHRVARDHDPSSLKIGLGAGEREAIRLAQRTGKALFIDDKEARKCAMDLGLDYFGSLGALKLAKQRGDISHARPLILGMVEAGIYFDDSLVSRFLADLGEL